LTKGEAVSELMRRYRVDTEIERKRRENEAIFAVMRRDNVSRKKAQKILRMLRGTWAVRDKHANWPVEHAFGGDDNAVDRRTK